MSEAINNPSKRKYNRKEIYTGDHAIPDQVINIDTMERGADVVQEVPDIGVKDEYYAQLAFNEEPVTIRIEPNARSDNPETHAPCSVNGRYADVLINGKWVPMGWLPIGEVITTKRKYVEVLARSNESTVRTVHDDATVEKPRNAERKVTSRSYPFTVIRDDNPRGHEWLTRILSGRE